MNENYLLLSITEPSFSLLLCERERWRPQNTTLLILLTMGAHSWSIVVRVVVPGDQSRRVADRAGSHPGVSQIRIPGYQHLRIVSDQVPCWPNEDIEATYIKTRKLLTMHVGFHPKSSIQKVGNW